MCFVRCGMSLLFKDPGCKVAEEILGTFHSTLLKLRLRVWMRLQIAREHVQTLKNVGGRIHVLVSNI